MSELDQLREQLAAVTAERDALRAALPKWRQGGNMAWRLVYTKDSDGPTVGSEVIFHNNGPHGCKWRKCDGWDSRYYPTRDSAMRASEEEYSLPICEVVND